MERANYSDIMDFGTKTVLVRVVDKEQETDFLVYENVIRKSSELINEKLNEPWNNAKERVVHLPTATPKGFSIYYQWLLTGRLHIKKQNSTGGISLLFTSCLLGHHLRDTGFMDTVHDAILQYSTENHTDTLKNFILVGAYLHLNLPEESRTKDLLVDIISWLAHDKETALSSTQNLFKWAFERTLKESDPDFVNAVFKVLALMCISQGPTTSPSEGWEMSCKYHCHGEEGVCYRKKAARLVKTPKQPVEVPVNAADRKLLPEAPGAPIKQVVEKPIEQAAHEKSAKKRAYGEDDDDDVDSLLSSRQKRRVSD